MKEPPLRRLLPLALLRRLVAAARTWRVRVVHPGRRLELELTLRPGTYRLWCSLGDHWARGMRATLRVLR